jgi:hypothetical protein
MMENAARLMKRYHVNSGRLLNGDLSAAGRGKADIAK